MCKVLEAYKELVWWQNNELYSGDDPPGWERRYSPKEFAEAKRLLEKKQCDLMNL